MIQISLPYIYEFSKALQRLMTIPEGASVKDSLYVLFGAEANLNAFLTQSIYSRYLKATVAPGTELLAAINKLKSPDDLERKLTFFNVWELQRALERFETVFTAELNTENAFFVTQTRGYDSSILINMAEALYPSEVLSSVPEVVDELRKAGRCIAFELSTAAGFHTMRAAELVLRRYWDVVTGGEERPKTGNMGEYLRELEQHNLGTPKIIAVLRQVKDLHRNELMHPEETLDIDEAIGLFNITQSAITAMIKEITSVQLELPLLEQSSLP